MLNAWMHGGACSLDSLYVRPSAAKSLSRPTGTTGIVPLFCKTTEIYDPASDC